MNTRIRFLLLACVWFQLVSASGCVAPDPPIPTVWDKLGVTGAYATVRDAHLNKFGNKPLKEWKPPKLRIADPKNLESKVPAIKVAAEKKQAEDLAEQKIKALKYLGLIGCSCYDKNGEIQAAFLDALNDCTPCVRLAAIEALTTSADECNKEAQAFNAARENCNPRTFGRAPRKKLLCGRCNGGGCNQCYGGYIDACGSCGSSGCGGCGGAFACGSCLGKEICKRLEEMAYKQNDEGCWLEPIPAIRSAAANLLAYCRPEPVEVTPDPIEIEGGGGEVPEGARDSIGDSTFNTSWNPQSGFVKVAQPSQSPTISGQIISSLNDSLFIQFSGSYKLPVGARIMAQTQNGIELELIVASSDVGQIVGRLVSANPPGTAVVGAQVEVGILAN